MFHQAKQRLLSDKDNELKAQLEKEALAKEQKKIEPKFSPEEISKKLSDSMTAMSNLLTRMRRDIYDVPTSLFKTITLDTLTKDDITAIFAKNGPFNNFSNYFNYFQSDASQFEEKSIELLSKQLNTLTKQMQLTIDWLNSSIYVKTGQHLPSLIGLQEVITNKNDWMINIKYANRIAVKLS